MGMEGSMELPHAQARIMSHNDAILYRCRGHRRRAAAVPEHGRTSGHWAADMVRELVDGPERQRLPVRQHARASASPSAGRPAARRVTDGSIQAGDLLGAGKAGATWERSTSPSADGWRPP